MSDELAQSLENVLRTVEAYDKEQPVQTRLSRKHDAMAYAILKARESLAVYRDHKARTLDGEAAPEYVTAADVCNKCGTELSYGDGIYCERCYEKRPTL